MPTNDHDTLIRIDENVKSIKRELIQSHKDRVTLFRENQLRKDWQENHDTKEKLVIAIASSIGGFLVFLATKIVDWFLNKKA